MIKYSAKNVGWNTTSPTQANTVLKESSWANLKETLHVAKSHKQQ